MNVSGKVMSERTILINISTVPMKFNYCGTIYVGHDKSPVTLLMDTGSSSITVVSSKYNAAADKNYLTETNYAQYIRYDNSSSGWNGPVIKTNVTARSEIDSVSLPNANIAIICNVFPEGLFRDCDGIFGLAYQILNKATKYNYITYPCNIHGKENATTIKTYLTQLEEAGLIANKFAFYTQRSLMHYGNESPADDPLNKGYLILGGGESYTDLYTGDFKLVKIIHDKY